MSINNINTNIAKVNSDLNTRNNRQNVFDKLRAQFAETKKNSQSIQKNQFYGVCLFYNRMTVDQFEEKFRSNESFIKYIYGQKDKIQASKSATIIQIFANIPEITGMLPEVKLQTLHNLVSLNNQSPKEIDDSAQNIKTTEKVAPPVASATASKQHATMVNLSEAERAALASTGAEEQLAETLRSPSNMISKSAIVELEKVMMYPRFYLYSEDNAGPSIGQICKFEFPSLKNLHVPTMGLGAFVSLTSDTIATLFPPKKLKESKKKSDNDISVLKKGPNLPFRRGSTGDPGLGAESIPGIEEVLIDVPEVELTQRTMARRPTREERERERESQDNNE